MARREAERDAWGMADALNRLGRIEITERVQVDRCRRAWPVCGP